MECLLKSSALMFIRYMTKRTQSHLIRYKTPRRNYRGGSIKTLLPSLPGHSVPANQSNTSIPVSWMRRYRMPTRVGSSVSSQPILLR